MVKITELSSGSFNARVYDYTDSAGKRHYKSITCKTKRDVAKEIAVFLANRENRQTRSADMTVGEAIDKYIDSKSNVLSPSTVREYKQTRRNALLDIMAIKLSKLTPDDVQRAVNKESETHSPKTVRNMHGLLSSTLAVYAPEIKLSTTLPKKVKPDINIPTEEEIRRLFREVEGSEIEIAVYLAAVCGMRRSEIAALEWSDIDLDKALLTVRSAKVLDADNQYVKKGTKTVAGKRTIRIFDPVLQVLEKITPTDDNLLLSMKPSSITQRYGIALKRAGLPHYRFHDLRHYAVSVMLSLNMPKNYIADYMGHETENMIDRVYGHIMKEAKQSFEDRVNEYYTALFTK